VDFERWMHASGAQLAPAEEEDLAAHATLDAILKIALARNFDLAEETARVQASVAEIGAMGRLPDLELKYEQWGVPLTRPWALDEANMLMLGLRQAFPAPGSLDAESRVAAESAEIALTGLRTRRLDIADQVRRAFFEYVLATHEREIHLDHAALAERSVELVRAQFRAGRATENDVLRLGIALTKFHQDVSTIEQRRDSAAALLDALMGRDISAPLGPPADLVPQEIQISEAELARLADGRPELAGAQHTLERSRAQLDGAERTANRPAFMLGLDYWYEPMGDTHHAYSLMASMTLPWLNPGRHEKEHAAAQSVIADSRALDSVHSVIRFQVHDAYLRYTAARFTFLIIDRETLPRTKRAYETAQTQYSAGGGDALALLDAQNAYLDARLDRERALVGLVVTIATVERAVGTTVTTRPLDDRSQP
jgi:outer membrane protein TolC